MYIGSMRITVDIAPEPLAEVLRLTGERKKSPAIAKAVVEFVRRRKAQEFGALLREGAFDYPMTNDDVENAEGEGHGAG